MAIVLPFTLSIQEMRVLQEFRRLGTETMTADAIKAIKHPVGGGEAPAQSLVVKGYLSAGDGGYTLTEKAKEFLAIDAKPEFESGGEAEEPAELLHNIRCTSRAELNRRASEVYVERTQLAGGAERRKIH